MTVDNTLLDWICLASTCLMVMQWCVPKLAGIGFYKMTANPKETMTTHEAHNKAMLLATRAIDLNEKAFELEKQAAMSLLDKNDAEPTRSVLFRSAANLAVMCGRFTDAEEMALRGLAGNPPDEIRGELNDVLKMARR